MSDGGFNDDVTNFDDFDGEKKDKSKEKPKILSMRKSVRKAQKYVKKLTDTVDKSADTGKIIEKVREFVKATDQTTVEMMERDEFDGAFKIIKGAIDFVTQMLKPRSGKCGRTLVDESLFKLNSLMAQLYNHQEQLEASIRFLETAMEHAETFMRLPGSVLYDLLPAEAYLNCAIAYGFMGKTEQAAHMSGKAEQLCADTLQSLNQTHSMSKQDRPIKARKLTKLIEAQQDLQIICLKTLAEQLQKQESWVEAHYKLKEGIALLEQNFGPQHPLLREFQFLVSQISHEIESRSITDQINGVPYLTKKGKHDSMQKKGRIMRTYYKVMRKVQNPDQRPNFSFKEELKKCKGDMDKEIHEERLYAQQLLGMRNMQDEKYRVMELMISTRAAVQKPKSCVYYPAQPCFVPEQEESEDSHSVDDSDSESSASSKGSEGGYQDAEEIITEQVYEEFDWTVTETFDGPTLKTEAIEKETESIWQVKDSKQSFRKAGCSFFFNEMSIPILVKEPPYVAPIVTATTVAVEQKQSRQPSNRRITWIQARIRSWLCRVRLRKERDSFGLVIHPFYIRTGMNVAIIELRSIKAKRNVTLTRTYTEGRREVDQTQEVEETEYFDAYQLRVKNYRHPHDQSAWKEAILQLDWIRTRAFVADIIRQGLTVVWDTLHEPYIKEIKFRQLTDKEHDHMYDHYVMLREKLEAERAEYLLRASFHQQKNYSSDEDGEGWRTSSMIKATMSKETECEKKRRIEAEMVFYAEREETEMDQRMRIEWEARQIMTSGHFRSVKLEKLSAARIKQLLGIKPKRDEAQVIHVNNIQRNQLTLIRFMKHEKKIVRVQGLIRGFLKRRYLFRTIFKEVCSFEHKQNDKIFTVTAHKRNDKLKKRSTVHQSQFAVEVTHKPSGQKLRQFFASLPSGQAKGGLESTLRRVLEILLNDEGRILSIRIQGVQTGDHEFIVDWRPHLIKNPGYHLIRQFNFRPSDRVLSLAVNKGSFTCRFEFCKYGPGVLTGGSNWECDHYFVQLRYEHETAGESIQYLRLKETPVIMEYMVYYLKEAMKPQLNRQKDAIDHFNLSNPQGGHKEFIEKLDQKWVLLGTLHRGTFAQEGKKVAPLGKKGNQSMHIGTHHSYSAHKSAFKKTQADIFKEENIIVIKNKSAHVHAKKKLYIERDGMAKYILLNYQRKSYSDAGLQFRIYVVHNHPDLNVKYPYHVVAVNEDEQSNTNWDFICLTEKTFGLGPNKTRDQLHHWIRYEAQEWLMSNLVFNTVQVQLAGAESRAVKKRVLHHKRKGYTSGHESGFESQAEEEIRKRQEVAQHSKLLLDYISIKNLHELSQKIIISHEVGEEDSGTRDAKESYAIILQSWYRGWKARRLYRLECGGVSQELKFSMRDKKSLRVALITLTRVEAGENRVDTRLIVPEGESDVIHEQNRTDKVQFLITGVNARELDEKCHYVYFDPHDMPVLRYQWIDYLRESITLKFEGSKLVKVSYVRLDFENNNKLSAIERQIKGQIDQMTNKKMGWLRCHSHTKENHYAYKDEPKGEEEVSHQAQKGSVIYTLFFTDIDKNLDLPYVRVTASRYWEKQQLELPAEEFFEGKHYMVKREFPAKDCFWTLNPNLSSGDLSLPEFESKIRYQENMSQWDKFIQCFRIEERKDGMLQLIFDERHFREIRFGFNVVKINDGLREQNAVNLIRKHVKLWIIRKHRRELRRLPGFLMTSSFVDVCGLRIGWFMMADEDQRKFSLTVKERHSGTTVINRAKISDQVIMVAKTKKNCEYALQGASKILKSLILKECIQLISKDQSNDKHSRHHEEWQQRLSSRIHDKMIR